MNIHIGNILHCLIHRFSSVKHYCVVVKIYYNDKQEVIAIDVLPITSKARGTEVCICLDCNDNCSKIHLTRDDTTQTFYELSYLFVKRYIVNISDCDCLEHLFHYTITPKLKDKLKTFKIYV